VKASSPRIETILLLFSPLPSVLQLQTTWKKEKGTMIHWRERDKAWAVQIDPLEEWAVLTAGRKSGISESRFFTRLPEANTQSGCTIAQYLE